MEPFSITCSSCQSRIRVRNPNLIGQIANCPKCGSMIKILASQKILVESPNGSPTDSVAVTRESLPAPETGLLGDLSEFEQAFRMDGLAGAADHSPLPSNDAAGLIGSIESNAAGLLHDPGVLPLAPVPGSTVSPRRKNTKSGDTQRPKTRQIVLVTAIGLCSLLLACGAFILFLRWFAAPSVALSPPSSIPPAQQAPVQQASENKAQVDGSLLNIDGNPPRSDELPFASNAAATGGPVEPLPASPSTTDSAADTEASSAVANIGTVPPAGDSSTKPTKETPPATGAPLATAASATDPIFNGLGGDVSPEQTQAIKEALPPGLKGFANIFDQSLVPMLPDTVVPLAAAPQAGNDAPAELESSSMAELTFSLPTTVDQKQDTPLGGLLIQNRPLAEVLSTLALLADIPFSVDLDGLRASGIDADMTVHYRSAQPVTVRNVLDKLKQDYKLSFEADRNMFLVVSGSREALAERLSPTLPIADLIKDDDQANSLAAALAELVPELADQLEVRDGNLQIELTDDNRFGWYQAARLLETWRIRRGIENASTSKLVARSNLLPEWPVAAAQARGEKACGQTLMPEPLASGLHRLCSEAGMTCWIDWPGLANSQIAAGKVTMTITRGRPLIEVLQQIADKQEIVLAIENDHTLWATSPEMHRYQSRLYVLPVAGKSIEQWTADLKPLAPFHPDGTEAFKILLAPDGQHLFVRCCRPLLVEPQL